MVRGKIAAYADAGTMGIWDTAVAQNRTAYASSLMGANMGGYFSPTSIGPTGIYGLISQGITALGPVLSKLGSSTVAKTAGQIVQKAIGPLVGGTAIGVSSGLTEEILKQIGTSGGTFRGFRKSRRMNVLNPRALRRSIRRVQGFSKFARKSFVFEKRVKMKKRRCR